MAKKSRRIAMEPGYAMYLRTSDEEVQSPERSQNAQRRNIEERLVRRYRLGLIETYTDNYTGTSADRRHYKRLLQDAREGKFSHVFSAAPDRFGRDDVEALRAIDELTAFGICVRFASHPDLEPADPDDRLYLNILFGMAKRESAVTSMRVRDGMLSKLLKGEWSWRAPDGYLNREIKLNESDLTRAQQQEHARYKRWVELDPAQGAVWRYAWDLLLQDRPTLDDICEALFARGCRLRDGRPFMRINRDDQRVSNKQALTRAFHNWFYAGWVVVQNEWANIPPKTVRGQWEPVVSTEEFELGLAILARRNQLPTPLKKKFYLLQGMVFLQNGRGTLLKLTCGTPNASRTANGVSYYCIPSSAINFVCADIDAQIPPFLEGIQVDARLLPHIRRTYRTDVARYTSEQARQQSTMEAALERIRDKELNLWRAFTEHGMHGESYEKLAREYQDEKTRIEVALKMIRQQNSEYIANLDAALKIISEIAVRYVQQDAPRRREILRQVVSRVVIDQRGTVLRLELQSPFTYLLGLADRVRLGLKPQDDGDGLAGAAAGSEASSGPQANSSLQVGFCTPSRTRTCASASGGQRSIH